MTGTARTTRRLAVLMFTDIVDSTAQRQRLGEQRAEELRVAVDELQIGLVTSNSGSVIKHLGDGMMCSFISAIDAMACAAGLQNELLRLSKRLPEPVGLRIGIAAGEVTDDDGDLFGMPVVHAARLCNACNGGDVYVADLVRELTARDPSIDLHDPSPMQLKGIDDEVLVWRLGWQQDDLEVALPPGLHRDEQFGFVGRSSEWQALTTAWENSARGELNVAVISGEAGVGKTRLVAELADWVRNQGGSVLFGRNDEDFAVPYQPFADSLRQYVLSQPEWAIGRRLGKSPGELVRLLPELATMVDDLSTPAESDAETMRYRLFQSVAQWIAEASSTEPLLLVIDDLHCASEPTLQLLRHLSTSNEHLAVMIVATFRDPDDSTAGAPTLPIPPHRSHLLRLGVFEEATVLDFLETAAGHSLGDLGPPLASMIHQRSGGNPFFCRELTLHLVDAGVLTQHEGRWVSTVDLDALGVPDSLRSVIDERLQRVSEQARQALLWASVIGLDIDVELLTAVIDAPDDQILEALDQCSMARLLDERGVDHFSFHHGLVRSVLTDSIGTTRHRRMHRAIAEALLTRRSKGMPVKIGELANHFEQGVTDDRLVEAVDLCREAGDAAMRQLAYEEAVDYFERALDLYDRATGSAPDLARQSDLTRVLAVAATKAGDPRSTELFERAFDAADASDDPFKVAEALLASSHGAASYSGSINIDRVQRLEDVLGRLGTNDHPVRARLLANLTTELQYSGDAERVLDLADKALAMARRLGDRSTRIFVLTERVAAVRFPDHLDAQLADVVELGRLCRVEGDHQAEFFASYRAADIHLGVNDLGGFEEATANAARLAEELGQPKLIFRALRIQHDQSWLHGDLDAAEAGLDHLARLAADMNAEQALLPTHMGFRAKVMSARGRGDEAVKCYEQLVRLPRSIDGFTAGLAVAHQQNGNVAEASSLYESLMAKGVENIGLDLTKVHVLCFMASLCNSLGDTDRAGLIEAELSPYRKLWVVAGAGSYGPAQHFIAPLLAMQGRDDDAERAFADASKRCHRMRAPLFEAWNQISWAQFLKNRGSTDRALNLVEAAALVGEDHRAAGIERLALEVIEDLGSN